MLEQFQKIVNLKNQPSKQGSLDLPKKRKTRQMKQKSNGNNETVQARAIEEMFGGSDDGDGRNNLHKITQAGKNYDALFLRIGAGILALIVVIAIFTFFSQKDKKPVVVSEEKKANWSAIILVNGEVYYGLVDDVNKNPVAIASVYYDYDQVGGKIEAEAEKASSSLRLVKKGKESHGPDGSMTIYQAQIKYIEKLKDDSKVLKAILDHENQ